MSLVLSRRTAEEIVIGSNIVITVHKITGNRVQLAIEAPREVEVVRAELRGGRPRKVVQK